MNPLGSRKRLYIALGLLASISLGGGLAATFIRTDLRLVGTVDADRMLLGTPITGRIEQLLVTEGQDVKAGDLIALISARELAAARESSLAQARSLESQWSAARANAVSTAGEVSNGVLTAQAALGMAQASLEEAAANRQRQESLTQRTLQLTRQGAMTVQDQDSAQRTLESLQAKERLAQKGLEQARAALAAARARTRQGQAALDTARSVEGQLKAARSLAQEAQARLDYTRIYAPVSGRIATVVAREGEVAASGSPVVELVALGRTWVYAPLPETEADAVTVGDTLTVRLPGGTRLQGRVIAKAAEADFATQRDASGEKRDIRTIRLKLAVPNPDGRLVPGMTAETILPAALRRKG